MDNSTEVSALQELIVSLETKNERLGKALKEARGKISEMSEQIEKLGTPPGSFATFISADHIKHEVVALVGGRKMTLSVATNIELGRIRFGQELKLNEQLVVIGLGSYEQTGEIVTVELVLDAERILVRLHTGDERVIRIAGRLQDTGVEVGDMLLADLRSGFALEHIERPDVEHLLLEETPNVSYEDIGGLEHQIEQIKDSVELPFEQPELYREHGLKPPKGVLLYGPPGCGKTLIAKAVATSLSEKIGGKNSRSYFLNIKGPQLLDKYVGETERQIREIFSRARDRASNGIPVVIFFDEMEALFRTRGSGVSSDVETTVVPQLLAEIDGVEELDNVIVIGASNREDMIDPAILRPGRLDIKIRIERPDRAGSLDIISKYLTPNLPIHKSELDEHGNAENAVQAMGEAVVEALYEKVPENEFVEVTYSDGEKEILYISDFVSGAMLAQVVDRAKKNAIKDLLATSERGIRTRHLIEALREETRENEDLSNITSPDEWARVNGRPRGKRVTFVRPLVRQSVDTEGYQPTSSERRGQTNSNRPVNEWNNVVREGLI